MRAPRYPIAYSDAELAWLQARKETPRRELHAAFVAEFGREVSFDNLKALMKRKGWLTGRSGCFVPGQAAYNKGMKVPLAQQSVATQFKHGDRRGRAATLYKPIGTERTSADGYLERKIHDGLPLQSRWRAVHLIRWEAEFGPVPDGQVLKCLDGDRSNTDPSNWAALPKGMVPKLSLRRGYDQAPAELRPVIMTLTKLEHAMEAAAKKAA